MFATETGELVRYSNAVRRGTILNMILLISIIPHLVSILMAKKLQTWVLNATFVACSVTVFMYFSLQFILTGYAYLQWVSGLVCTVTLFWAVLTRFFRSWVTLSLLAALSVSMLVVFAAMTGLSWSRRLLKPEFQSKMMPVIYTKR